MYIANYSPIAKATMKSTKVQTLGAFLLCILQKYLSLQWLFQLACNQKIVFLTGLEVFTTVLPPQMPVMRLYSTWTLVE